MRPFLGPLGGPFRGFREAKAPTEKVGPFGLKDKRAERFGVVLESPDRSRCPAKRELQFRGPQAAKKYP